MSCSHQILSQSLELTTFLAMINISRLLITPEYRRVTAVNYQPFVWRIHLYGKDEQNRNALWKNIALPSRSAVLTFSLVAPYSSLDDTQGHARHWKGMHGYGH